MKFDRKYSPLLALLLILAIGIFLRIYRFDEWVRFNDDQARDATLIRDVLSGHKPLPLLGPVAAGTRFHLGPAFYYFQYAAGSVFGETPDHLAYPDLFLSILAIPTLFLFLRKCFSDRISLAVTAIAAVSAFAVGYSRFAWNPNSLPFFVLLFLYSLVELETRDRKREFAFSILAGLSLGIGIQLHALFLFIAPFVLLAFFSFGIRKNHRLWKPAAILLSAALAVNLPQIVSEVGTHGRNTRALVSGITAKSDTVSSVGEYILINGVCQVRNNAMIVSSFGELQNCHLAGFREQLRTERTSFGNMGRAIALSGLLLGIIFTVGGYGLLFTRARRETDEKRKRALSLVSLYAAIASVVFIPFATVMTSRYFLVIEFVPFFFLALWFEYAAKRFGKFALTLTVTAVIVLAFLNLRSVSTTFASYDGAHPERVEAPESVTLSDIRSIAAHIRERTGSADTVYVDDRSGDTFGMMKGLAYFLDPAGIKVKQLNKGTDLPKDASVFSIDLAKVSPEEEIVVEPASRRQLASYTITDHATFGRFTVFGFGQR
ncbi:MAG TPA: glycosyltransferase family 39 protein [Candidatus Fimivivens sp.]|nr:glycosyltransferase family 39 protein [Candidatus Fimivivens sp.]